MGNENKTNTKKHRWLYLLASINVLSVYAFLFFPSWIEQLSLTESASNLQTILELICRCFPFILGLVNLTFLCTVGKCLERKYLLNCTVWMKCALIPFYIVGGVIVVLFSVMTFIPVPFMIFLGPTAALTLCAIGWSFLAATAPFSVSYILKSHKEGYFPKTAAIIACVMQFLFFFDVITMILFTFKEKQWKS